MVIFFRVNCSFYFKIGACRHGDRCSRIHNKPTFSQTVLLQNLYVNPQNSAKSADGSHCEYCIQYNIQLLDNFSFKIFLILILVVANVSDEEMQEHYDNFFEDVFVECEDKYGEIEEMNVCDNLGDHLVGNVYIKVSVCPRRYCNNETLCILKFTKSRINFFLNMLTFSFAVRRMQKGL